jgi:GNAT superfamily N-acetyltransferase
VKYRQATASDVPGIARLHAESWRRHYRGAYLDSYLDGDVVADRIAEWADRLSWPRADRYTVVADLDGAVAGFAHVILDADPTWGAYLDALHVGHDLKRHGIGARLIAEIARAVADRRPSAGLYLWVLEQNAAAGCSTRRKAAAGSGASFPARFPAVATHSRSAMPGRIPAS